MMPAIKQQSKILLSELLDGVAQIKAESDCAVNAVQIDSRLIESGDVFVAFSGVNQHGLSFLPDIVKAGANCVLYAADKADDFQQILNEYKHKIVQVAVDDIRDTAGVVISKFYNEPSKALDVIGITGTDGKTSVSRFIAQALSVDSKTAVIGTTGNGMWGELVAATHTTPDVLSLHKLIFDLKNKSASTVVMEVSSHGIDQQRIAGMEIDTAVLTNVSRDHLDYHGSVENYRETKKQLFTREAVKNVVVNLDDETGKVLAKELYQSKNVWGYSLSPIECDDYNCVYADSITVNESGFNVAAVTPVGDVELTVPLLGRFNVANALTVLVVLLLKGVKLNEAAERIAQLETAPGRMEVFRASNRPMMVVDFAHTPKALELALQALYEHCKGKVWCVFGCGGDRDQGKRALMGAVAEKFSDHVIVTDDNPRHENNTDIIDQILSGFKNKKEAVVISNRKQAIEYAHTEAAPNDVVLVAGKGHEDYQIVGDLKLAFSDREEVKRLIGGGQ